MERGHCHCLPPGVLPGRKLSPDTHPDTSHFSFSSYATGARPAVALVLYHRGRESAQVLNLPWSPKRSLLRIPHFLPAAPTPTGFYNQKLWGLIFLVLEPGLGGQVWDWDLLLPRYPSLFLSTAGEYETTCSASPCHSVSPCLSTSPKGPRMLIYYSTIIMKEGSCNIFRGGAIMIHCDQHFPESSNTWS